MEVSEEVLQAVVRHQGLRVVGMDDTDLASVDPSLLARLVARMEEVGMRGTRLTVQQVEAVFNSICSGDSSRLKKLDISHNNLSTVSPVLLASAVNSLQEGVLSHTQLTREEGEAILTAITSGDSRLKILNISGNNLSKVDPGLLASAVNRLEEVEVEVEVWVGGYRWNTRLTVEQVEAILTQSLVKTSLRRLEMRGVRGLDEDLVARASLAIGQLDVWSQ